MKMSSQLQANEGTTLTAEKICPLEFLLNLSNEVAFGSLTNIPIRDGRPVLEQGYTVNILEKPDGWSTDTQPPPAAKQALRYQQFLRALRWRCKKIHNGCINYLKIHNGLPVITEFSYTGYPPWVAHPADQQPPKAKTG